MKTSLIPAIAALGAVAALISTHERRPSPSPAAATPATRAEGAARLGHLPVAFVPNLGQWDEEARYVARIGAMTVFLEPKGWTFTLTERSAPKEDERAPARGVAVRMTFAGASRPVLAAQGRLPGRHSYFLGNDPTKWRSDVPLYRSVLYREVGPGIDVRAREQNGHFEYDLFLQPGAQLASVEIAVEGIDRMHVDADGALVLETLVGPVRMPVPVSWEEGPSGVKCPVACRYVVHGANRFGFAASDRRPDWALVVDPGLVWSTFLGGTNDDSIWGVAVDAQGAATVAGYSASTSFPTTLGAFDTTHNGGIDAFVTKLSSNGSSLIYSTFLGGSGSDVLNALALDAQGGATVVGSTNSPNFPTTPGAFDTTYNSGYDAFVTRLSPSGSTLVYSTFVGGPGYDQALAVAVDAQGAATVAGGASRDYPTTPGAFKRINESSHYDAFVTQLSSMGSSLVYSTYVGGEASDIAIAVALDAQGGATIAGATEGGFPTTPGAFDTTDNGGDDAFVTRLSPTGSSLVYSTLIGGSRNDSANALALDVQGGATIAGMTDYFNYPTTPGAFDTTWNGGLTDAFVTRLSPTGSSLVYSTFLGGTGMDMAGGIALDAQGMATVAGKASAGFPTTPGAFDTTGDVSDAFVARLSPTGSSLVYSTFLGGASGEGAYGVALDAQGMATVVGNTTSASFPTTPGAFDTTYDGAPDGFVTRLDLLPTGVTAFGRSSPGCTGPLAISVNSMPRVGNQSFALTCGNAPPSMAGLLVLTGSRFQSPLTVFGVEVWLDPTLVYLTFPAISNQVGAGSTALPIPNRPGLASVQLFVQFLWLGPRSPLPCPRLGMSASNALEITIQP